MTIISKITLTALLVGVALPALAQGTVAGTATTQTAPKASTAHHAPLLHKVSSPVEATKPSGSVTMAPAKVGGLKTEVLKTEPVKPSVNTGLAKPAVPLTGTTVTGTTSTVVPKTN